MSAGTGAPPAASPEEIMDELTYINFRHNVRLAPNVPIQRWEAVYGPSTNKFAERLAEEQRRN